MPVLFLTPRHTDDTQKLWRACIAAKWGISRVNGWKVDTAIPASEVVIYGEPIFAQHVANTFSLTLRNPDSNWLPALPLKWSGRKIQAMTLHEARALASPHFIKPADGKEFPAKIYASGEELPGDDLQPGQLPVLAQEIVIWKSEFRCFVREGRVVTASIYSRYGKLAQANDESWPTSKGELDAVIHFCEAATAENAHGLPNACVVDVGEIEGTGWAVIESNAAWGSGIYGCDPVKVLSVLRHACVVR